MLSFNALLVDAGINPTQTRLLRHSDTRNAKTPYALWRDNVAAFDDYQRVQKRSGRAKFRGDFWASFVVTPARETLFVGLYTAAIAGDVPSGWVDPLVNRPHDWSEYEIYNTQFASALSSYAGRLLIEWGDGNLAWCQLAANKNKPIAELRRVFREADFPGYSSFIAQLSELGSFPKSWEAILANTRGVYLLTCPRTREQYVGSATGESGFFGRWQSYVADGHGGNVGLRSREPSDYRVSILQVAGSGDDTAAVLAMEQLWKAKLQSREMGLNKN